jgi:hypothetical protein
MADHNQNIDVTKPSAAVDAGSLVLFMADVSEQHRSDVLNSLLLAQLSASKQFDREVDTDKWYVSYRDVLEQIGWVVQQQTSFLPLQIDSPSLTIDELIISSMKTIVDENEVAGLKAMLDNLKGLDSRDRRVLLFEDESHSARNGSFQISIISESGGVVVMKLAVFFFSTTHTVTSVLSFNFLGQDTKFFQGSQIMNLNEDVYAGIRQDIINRLGDRVGIFIADIEI